MMHTHILANPKNTNLAAIKAYEKAGFKKSTQQPGTSEVWMIREQTARPDPLCTIQKLIQERCSHEILEELKSREPIFHHSEKYGKTIQDIGNQMCDEFWEVGASGNVYTKQDVIETLCERYNDPNYEDIWETKDFELTQIAADNYLLTYVLIQNKTRVTRRSPLWRKVGGNWKILYHQGTLIDGDDA